MEDLLDTSAIVMGKLKMDARPVDLGAVLEAATIPVPSDIHLAGIQVLLVDDQADARDLRLDPKDQGSGGA